MKFLLPAFAALMLLIASCASEPVPCSPENKALADEMFAKTYELYELTSKVAALESGSPIPEMENLGSCDCRDSAGKAFFTHCYVFKGEIRKSEFEVSPVIVETTKKTLAVDIAMKKVELLELE